MQPSTTSEQVMEKQKTNTKIERSPKLNQNKYPAQSKLKVVVVFFVWKHAAILAYAFR